MEQLARAAVTNVVYVMEVTRYGYRTPLTKFGWTVDEPLGVLTEQGYAQHLELGKAIRQLYPHLLSSEYRPAELLLKCTNYQRSLKSLEAQLKGLYEDLSVEDVAILAEPHPNDEFLLLPHRTCPRLNWLLKRDSLNSAEYAEFLAKLQPHAATIQRLVGSDAPAVSLESAFNLGDVITSYQPRGLALPSEVDDELAALAREAYAFGHDFMIFGSAEALKLVGHSFTSELLKVAQEVIQGTTQAKFGLYMTHTITLHALLKVLGFRLPHPPAAASLFIELHREGSQYFLRLVYQGEVLVLPGCSELCPLEHFSALTQGLRYASDEEWMTQCMLTGDQKTDSSGSSSPGTGSVGSEAVGSKPHEQA
jgi:hypothetical protein